MASSLLVQSEEMTPPSEGLRDQSTSPQPPTLSREELEVLERLGLSDEGQERLEDEPDALNLQDASQNKMPAPIVEGQGSGDAAFGLAPDHKIEEALKAPVVERLEPLSSPFEVLDELLRERRRLLTRIERGQDLRQIARAMLLVIGCSAAALGAVLGMYRGGVQVLYAGIKLPLVLIGAATVCAPVYTTLKRSLGDEAVFAKDLALFLSALALASLMAASLSPLLLCAILDGVGYHALILSTVALVGIGGLAGYVFFFRGMSMQIKRGHRVIATTLLVVMGLVGSQLSWLMRPYLVRPQTQEVPFVRALEGSFFDAVVTSISSSQGQYKRTYPYGAARSRALEGSQRGRGVRR